MIKIIQVKIVGGKKSGKSPKQVIDLVRNDEAIPKGDVGAYIVGVFLCQPLTTADGKNYDVQKRGQGKLCIFRKQWEEALRGIDKFTEEDKSLILAGEECLKKISHGWGNKAIAHPHVKKLLEKWKNSNNETNSEDQILNLKNDLVTRAMFNDVCDNLKKYDERITFDTICNFIDKKYDSSGFDINWRVILKEKILEWKLEDDI